MADDARDYVAQLYEQELGAGRGSSGDPGIQAWADQIASGAMSREAVQQAIAASQEGVRYDIGQAYERELGPGRSTSGDPGLQQWVNAVTGGGMTTQQAIDQIARSQEAARYDIGREYTGTLQRQGTYQEMAAKDPGIAQWEQALMNGSVTEQQFRNAVLQSQEYKALQGTPTTPGTPKEDPNAKIIKDLQDTIAANQKAFEAQQAAWAEQQKAYEQMVANAAKNQAAITSGYQRQIQPLQQSLLSTNATENATRGFFSPAIPTYAPTVPTYSPAVPGAATPGTTAPTQGFQGSFTPTYAAPAGSATSIAPAPGYFVPQTYLAPAPPQYRNVNPFTPMFGTPFSGPGYTGFANSPFESYYNIATRRFGYPNPYSTQQGQGYPSPYVESAPAGTPTTTTPTT